MSREYILVALKQLVSELRTAVSIVEGKLGFRWNHWWDCIYPIEIGRFASK